jgi:hypothetical protein
MFLNVQYFGLFYVMCQLWNRIAFLPCIYLKHEYLLERKKEFQTSR